MKIDKSLIVFLTLIGSIIFGIAYHDYENKENNTPIPIQMEQNETSDASDDMDGNLLIITLTLVLGFGIFLPLVIWQYDILREKYPCESKGHCAFYAILTIGLASFAGWKIGHSIASKK